VEEDRCPEARPHIGGTGSEVAELVMKGVGELLAELLIEGVHGGPGTAEAESRGEGLEAEMVLLIHHDRDRPFVRKHHRTPLRRTGRLSQEVPGDQASLHEDFPVARREGFEFVELRSGKVGDFPARRRHPVEDRRPVVHTGAGAEGMALQVPGKPDPCRENDVGMFSRGVEPRQSEIRGAVQITHGRSPHSRSARVRGSGLSVPPPARTPPVPRRARAFDGVRRSDARVGSRWGWG
jgi:hypothetical protein